MNQLYLAAGCSKQAVFQYSKRQHKLDHQMSQLIGQADALREKHPGCGVEKMYYSLKPDFIGRDRFVETFMDLGYRLKRAKNYRRTTIASKLYYPNLIKGMTISEPSEIWQSDITYIKVNNTHCYAVFIIDVYTREIVGYSVSNNMRAHSNMKALKMALKGHRAPTIHHSDRGSQYTSKEYTELLESHGSRISMGLIAQDNAYAERINGTIKNEYLLYWKSQSLDTLKKQVRMAVENYNHNRIHLSLNRTSPINFQQIRKHQTHKTTLTIFNDNSI